MNDWVFNYRPIIEFKLSPCMASGENKLRLVFLQPSGLSAQPVSTVGGDQWLASKSSTSLPKSNFHSRLLGDAF